MIKSLINYLLNDICFIIIISAVITTVILFLSNLFSFGWHQTKSTFLDGIIQKTIDIIKSSSEENFGRNKKKNRK
ncbi:MAG TPA: hypothetical protein PLG90_13320 [Ignavibacteria bacterium]|nr:hypothetical protein [Ignavibacteria bacterium]